VKLRTTFPQTAPPSLRCCDPIIVTQNSASLFVCGIFAAHGTFSEAGTFTGTLANDANFQTFTCDVADSVSRIILVPATPVPEFIPATALLLGLLELAGLTPTTQRRA
jgi:hypothetical protein